MPSPDESSAAHDTPSLAPPPTPQTSPRLSEDWTACLIGLLCLAIGLCLSLTTRPSQLDDSPTASESKSQPAQKIKWDAPTKSWLGKLTKWKQDPLDAFREEPPKASESDATKSEAENVSSQAVAMPWRLKPILGAFAGLIVIGLCGAWLRGQKIPAFLCAFPVVFGLATLAYVLASQSVIKNLNLEYALWALLVGMLISNTVGTPQWLRPAVAGELYIKTGLVLMGAGVLLSRLFALGLPGVFVSWVVTPIVLVSTYLFGQLVLRMASKSLNMVISADMSVCGVSAAIATAAACKAKKEELSLAVGLSLSFTVIMMFVMPIVVKTLDLPPEVGGAWIGGTIDATGAVVAAGSVLDEVGEQTAVTVKMIQNILIGVVAFGVALYWTRVVDSKPDDDGNSKTKVGLSEIWNRFPKFVLGFVGASIICSIIHASSIDGELWVNSVVKGFAKPLRGWLFCIAFVCIGLETNFRELMPYLRTGKPAVLYLCGQALNILLTFLMSYLMFGIIFASE